MRKDHGIDETSVYLYKGLTHFFIEIKERKKEEGTNTDTNRAWLTLFFFPKMVIKFSDVHVVACNFEFPVPDYILDPYICSTA